MSVKDLQRFVRNSIPQETKNHNKLAIYVCVTWTKENTCLISLLTVQLHKPGSDIKPVINMENTDNENLDESVYDPLKNILPNNFLDHFHTKWDGSI